MSYYFRFIATDDTPITLGELETGLRQIDARYSVAATTAEQGELLHESERYSLIEIDRPPRPLDEGARRGRQG